MRFVPDKLTKLARSFPSEHASIRDSRLFVRRFAEGWPFSTGRLADIELAASELSTNAVVHGAGDSYEVALEGSPLGLSLSVTSTGSQTFPQVRQPRADEESGRGLLIVSRVGDTFAITQTPNSVTVSCSFEIVGQPSTSTPPGSALGPSPRLWSAPCHQR